MTMIGPTPVACSVDDLHPCGCSCSPERHRTDCIERINQQPNAMWNAAGEVFYPNSLDDADRFAKEHDARPVSHCAFTTWSLREVPDWDAYDLSKGEH